MTSELWASGARLCTDDLWACGRLCDRRAALKGEKNGFSGMCYLSLGRGIGTSELWASGARLCTDDLWACGRLCDRRAALKGEKNGFSELKITCGRQERTLY